MKYVSLVIANKSDSTDTLYTYGCEFDNVAVGDKVYVPFNRSNRIKEAYVFSVADNPDKEFANLKYVKAIDEDIALSKEAIATCIWMRKQYFCRYIDAVEMFLPAGSKAKRRERKEPVDAFEGERQDIERLTDEQEIALREIKTAISNESYEKFLLYGVTGSGKTEIYMRSARLAIDNGKTVILTVPEVSLTNQIIERFISRFGRKNIAIIHSKMTAGERYDQWQKIKNGQVKIVIGARSAVFAPLENIGLIIIDEEHEASYKSDMTPKYETCEVAAKRAEYYGGCVIMGSATPSVTSFLKCREGEYKKLTLKERYNKMPLPEVFIQDMRKELKEGNRTVFSKKLYDETKRTLSEGGQVLYLINRRGYSSFISCRNCGYVVKCDHCDIPMTYHKDRGKLICHYCGRTKELPKVCPECGSGYIKFFGSGTERIQKEAEKFFPEAAVERLDFDTAKNKRDMDRIINNFAKGKTNILVGTQLAGKGMDYKNVDLAGILAVDTMLNLPDYRASERTFQLIAQAAGRTGRGEKRGKVVVQTYQPDSFPILSGAAQDAELFFEKEIKMREIMGYPPFGILGQFSIMAENAENANKAQDICKREIENAFGRKVIIGIKKYVKGEKDFRIMILIKFPREKRGDFQRIAENIKDYSRENKSGVSVIIDTNPYTLWRN